MNQHVKMPRRFQLTFRISSKKFICLKCKNIISNYVELLIYFNLYWRYVQLISSHVLMLMSGKAIRCHGFNMLNILTRNKGGFRISEAADRIDPSRYERPERC